MTIQRRANPMVVAAAVLGILGTLTAQATVFHPELSNASSPACHVGPAAGTYTCTVVVDPGPTASPSVAPSPSVLVTPSPAPTPTVTPAPTPTPTSQPTPAPTSSPVSGIPVPATIDATGNQDITSSLNAFLNGVPANSTVVFPAGGIYRITAALKLTGRTNLALLGNGATIKITGSGFNENYSLFYLSGSANSGISISGFNLVGDSTDPGHFIGGEEGQMGVLVDGARNTTVSGNVVIGVYGDGFEVNSGASGTHITGNTIVSAGRNALSVIWGTGVEFDHNTVMAAGYVTFDVEPNNSSEPSSFINIHDNVGGTWLDAFFAVDGSSTGAAIHDITVANNTSATGLLSVVNPSGKAREPRIAFTGNTGPGTASFSAHAVDGLTVQHNSAITVTATSCTAVVSGPNP